MSISISLEEYELFKSFIEQIEEKKKQFFYLNMEILEREEKMNQCAIFYEKEKKIAYDKFSLPMKN